MQKSEQLICHRENLFMVRQINNETQEENFQLVPRRIDYLPLITLFNITFGYRPTIFTNALMILVYRRNLLKIIPISW